jgi:hypothetical protein
LKSHLASSHESFSPSPRSNDRHADCLSSSPRKAAAREVQN